MKRKGTKWIPNECRRLESLLRQKISVFLFSSHPPRTPHFAHLIANVGYRPNVDFGSRGLEGGLSTLESVVYACPDCAAAPKLRLCG